jgi:Tfp pilus assembly protein PilO
MPRNFEAAGNASAIRSWLPSVTQGGRRNRRFWLQLTGGILALLNGVALFFYLVPPGGSRRDLAQEQMAVRAQLANTRTRTRRLRTRAAEVQVSSAQSSGFEAKYFLPKRTAYETVIAEIQRMAKASGLQERDSIYMEEPIEGVSDLSLLNITASYEGTYQNLMEFLHQVDRCPMLLMMENLQAAPQQKGGQINTSIRFQAIIQEEAGAALGGGQ